MFNLSPLPPDKDTVYYRFRYGSQLVMALLAYGVFRCMPLAAASALGGWLMALVGPHLSITRRVVLRNLDLAFPDKGAVEKDAIMRGMWNNLGRTIAEYPHLRRISDVIEVKQAEHFRQIAQEGKPVIFFSGHLANWETCAVVGRSQGTPIHVVYRKPNNPWVDGLLQHARGAAIGHIRKGQGAGRDIVMALRRGDHVGMLLDQKMNEGIAVPFFGHDVMTADAIVTFAKKFHCPIYPVWTQRLQGARFCCTIYPPIHVAADDDSRVIMAQINGMLESWIRQAPEQWLWTHRRWPKEFYTK